MKDGERVNVTAQIAEAAHRSEARAIKNVCRVVKAKSRGILTSQLEIVIYFSPPALQSVRVRGLVVVLMHSHNKRAGVHHGSAKPSGLIDKPMIPPSTADTKLRNVRPQSSREGEKIAVAGRWPLLPVPADEFAQAILTALCVKIPRLTY